MSSVSAWNDMMEQFLTELGCSFPEEKAIKKYQTSFDLLRKSNPRKCVEGFMAEASKVQEKIMNKEDSFFLDSKNQNISFIKDLNIRTHWTPELSEKTKDAIWQYLQTLIVLGTTITMIPQETLNSIESIASECANNMQSGNAGLDPSVLSGLFSSISGIMGNGLLEKK
jgi:hypothetical protein